MEAGVGEEAGVEEEGRARKGCVWALGRRRCTSSVASSTVSPAALLVP